MNADRVLVLADTNIASLEAAMLAGDLDAIRMIDGTTPTAAQLKLITESTAEDLEAARTYVMVAAEAARHRASSAKRALELVDRHARRSDEPLGEIVPRMNPDERTEFQTLMGWLA